MRRITARFLAALAAGTMLSAAGVVPAHAGPQRGEDVSVVASATSASPHFGRYGRPFDDDPAASPASEVRELLAAGRNGDADLLKRITNSPRATWFGGWNRDIATDVSSLVRSAESRGAIATTVAYNIPNRDCGSESRGGAESTGGYRTWIDGFARGLGDARVIVVLEPDALAQMDCLSGSAAAERIDLISYAVSKLSSQGSYVYIDAGHSAWQPSEVMARRLTQVGVAKAAGFSLNVSNFQPTGSEITYGESISKHLGTATNFVIDTSRNGVMANSAEWCNARGRGLGFPATTATASSLVDAYLWVKRPGESDGMCGGGPGVGTFWTEYALELARNAVVVPPPTSRPAVDRIAGVDRFDTAVQISRQAYPFGAPVVYVATGTNYPDALSAGAAAVRQGGPVLLTAGDLPQVVRNEIVRLKPGRIVVVGGPHAVSDDVFAALRRLVRNTVRIAGADRYETSRAVVRDAFGATGSAAAYLATGSSFPDALVAGGAAGSRNAPVLLVDGRSAFVDPRVADLLDDLGVRNVTIAGGTSSVSDATKTGLGRGFAVTRAAGIDRFTTSQNVNRTAFASAGRVFLATGYNFPDAMAGSALAGATRSPLYIIPTDCVPQTVLDDIAALHATRVTLLGGPASLGAGAAALTACSG